MDDRPLIITDDELMLDDLLRVAAAAGVEVTHSREPEQRAPWRSAPLVVIDAALVRRAAVARLPRRPGVVMVATAEPRADLWEYCVQLGVDRTIRLDSSEELLIGVLADAVASGAGDGLCVAVLGACGGAGASVFAAVLAFTATRDALGRGDDARGRGDDARGRGDDARRRGDDAHGRDGEVLLVDCDPGGAGLDLMLGLEDAPGLRWADLAARSGRLPVDALQRALPGLGIGSGRVGVLSHGRQPAGEISADVMTVVLDAGRRAGCTTVVDLPRYPGQAADRVLEQADLVVLVTPADVRGCWAADRLGARIRPFGSRAGVVVRGPSPGGMGASEVADFLGLPLLARMRPVRSLANELESGLTPNTRRHRQLTGAARDVLLALRAST